MVEPVNDNILNLVNELYNNLDAKDKIINEQVLEIARLKDDKKRAREYIKKYQEIQAKYCYVDFDNEDIETLLELLGDKE